MNKKLRIGIVARCDFRGLGMLTLDFWKHIKEITKELVVVMEKGEQEVYRYPKGIIVEGYPTLETIDEFLKDIDVVVAFETPYNWNVFSTAKRRGIKTVLIPMYEWSTERLPIEPDLYLCPSLLDYDIFPEPKKYLPVPIDRKLFPFKLRKKAKIFLFNNGYGGTGGRNGLEAFLQAIPLVKSDVRFIINSQVSIPEIKDPRVKVRVANIKSRADLFTEGDVFVFPHMFNGLSLPIQEALSCGMPVLSTNIYPHNTYMPKDWFFEPDSMNKGKVHPVAREIDMAIISVKNIAKKIDEWANKDITEESQKANEIAEKISWKNMKDKYIKVFNNL